MLGLFAKPIFLEVGGGGTTHYSGYNYRYFKIITGTCLNELVVAPDLNYAA